LLWERARLGGYRVDNAANRYLLINVPSPYFNPYGEKELDLFKTYIVPNPALEGLPPPLPPRINFSQSPSSLHSLPYSPMDNGYAFIDRPSTYTYESIGSIYNAFPAEQPTSSINWRKTSHVPLHDRVWAFWHNMRTRRGW
jgi:hypothetical protein